MLPEVIGRIRSGSISAEERIRMFLERIELDNPHINSVLHVNSNAIEEAKRIDERIKTRQAGKLAGLGIIVKPNISVKGLPISCGSKVLENYIGSFDADVISAIRREDGIILGMANCDEFASGSSGENSAFGPTQNPTSPGRIPGGSSSGSAASVAAGFCDIALGSDTGGSIRNPASHCGVFGFKPTYGLVSRHGLVDLSMSLDVIGPICKDAYGIALMMDVISGSSENDAKTIPHERIDFLRGIDDGIKGKTVGLCSIAKEMCSEKRIYDVVESTAENMKKNLGVKLIDIDIPHIDLSVQAYYPLVYVEFFSGTRKFDGKKYGKPIEEFCGEEVLRRILGGKEISRAEYEGKYYRLALKAKMAIKIAVEKAFEKVDFIVLPVTPKLPHRIGDKITDPRVIYAYDAFTIPANFAGICAISVPAGEIDGCPVGMQILAKSFNDATLLRAARVIERLGIKNA
ncbi:MAG: amidase family protein [Nanoarchaeota archaeon]